MNARILSIPVLWLPLLAACGEPEANSPAESAAPIAGPASFVGRWAADAAWCASPQADRRPIVITPTRFEGYENNCAITAVTQVPSAYEAVLACEAEGERTTERVRLAVAGDTLTLSYPDRPGEGTALTRCAGA